MPALNLKNFFLFALVTLAGGCSSTQENKRLIASVGVSNTQDSACQNTDTAFKCVKVVEVYDGDTIFVDLPGIPPLFGKKIGVRIEQIDTPEIHTKDRCEKEKAREAKAVVENIIRNAHRVDIINVRRDKYFRVLGTVLVDGKSISEELLKRDLAYRYSGGKKLSKNWCK